jgi:hypothetical protein
MDGDALLLVNFLDELTYRIRSNLGCRPFKPLKEGLILVGGWCGPAKTGWWPGRCALLRVPRISRPGWSR